MPKVLCNYQIYWYRLAKEGCICYGSNRVKRKTGREQIVEKQYVPCFFCVDNLAAILKKQGKKLLKAYIWKVYMASQRKISYVVPAHQIRFIPHLTQKSPLCPPFLSLWLGSGEFIDRLKNMCSKFIQN